MFRISGTAADIDNALTMIRQRFPPNKYPNITLDQISLAPTPATFPLVPDFCQVGPWSILMPFC